MPAKIVHPHCQSTPLCDCIMVWLSIRLLTDIWVISSHYEQCGNEYSCACLFYAFLLGSKDLKTSENLNPNLCDSKAYILATTPHNLPPSSAYSPYIILNKDSPSLERTNITTFSENALLSACLWHVSEHFAGC